VNIQSLRFPRQNSRAMEECRCFRQRPLGNPGRQFRNYHILAWLAGRASVRLACLADEPVGNAMFRPLKTLVDRWRSCQVARDRVGQRVLRCWHRRPGAPQRWLAGRSSAGFKQTMLESSEGSDLKMIGRAKIKKSIAIDRLLTLRNIEAWTTGPDRSVQRSARRSSESISLGLKNRLSSLPA
jgi:hypothetical protein